MLKCRPIAIHHLDYLQAIHHLEGVFPVELRSYDLDELLDTIPKELHGRVLADRELFQQMLKNGIGLLSLDCETILAKYPGSKHAFPTGLLSTNLDGFIATKWKPRGSSEKMLAGFGYFLADVSLNQREKRTIGELVFDNFILTEPIGQVLKCYVSNRNHPTLRMWRYLGVYGKGRVEVEMAPFDKLAESYTEVTIRRIGE